MTREERIELLATITSGLLASGHYTVPVLSLGGKSRLVRSGDHWSPDALREAEAILESLECRVPADKPEQPAAGYCDDDF